MNVQCQRCEQRPAVVHQTVVVNGDKKESYLCETCARELGQQMGPAGAFGMPNLSINQLLASFLGQAPFGAQPSPAPRRQAEPACKHCGLTYSQFAESGRLGCAQCYEELGPHLLPLVKRIHGTLEHAGKAPKRTGGIVRQKRELSTLQNQLQTAVGEERFEEAARLRDRIAELKQQIEAGGEAGAVE